MPGPRQTPSRVLTARGSTWPTAGHGDVLVDAPPEVPPPPEWLPAAAQARYLEVATFFQGAKALSASDLPVVTRYAVTWTKWASSEQRLAAGEDPKFMVTGGRYGDRDAPSPARCTSTEAPRELARLERVLGLSPADRGSLGLSAPTLGGEDDPVERMLAEAWAEPAQKTNRSSC